MSVLEAFRAALENLAANKLRAGLSALGMIFGVGAVIAMLSIGAGAQREAMRLMEQLGLRNVIVRDRQPDDEEKLREIRSKSPGLSPRDMMAIAEGVPGVERVAPRVEVRAYKILAGERTTEAKVYGVSHEQDELVRLVPQRGRFLDRLDELRHAQVAVIGPGVARDLFGSDDPLGRLLKINDVWFEVVGVLPPRAGESRFEGVAVGSSAREIYLPFTTAMRKFERDAMKAPLDGIVVQLGEAVAPQLAADVIDSILKRLHAGIDDYELVVPEALLEQRRRTQRLFNIVMGCIAGISLVVGGIGIMNIMLASVLERTSEIGLRRAVGARRKDIRTQFLVESFAISVLGGLAGVAMGIAIARVVAAWAGWSTVVTAGSVVLATGVSVAVGLVSGLYPAVRAAALDPIDALRYE